jgi:hypothetical protein
MKKFLITSLVVFLASIAWATTPTSITTAAGVPSTDAATSTSQSLCPKRRKFIRRGKVAVFVWMFAHRGTVLDREEIDRVRRYRGKNYTNVGLAFSGCVTVIPFKRSKRPSFLCIVVRSPFVARNNQPCPHLRKDVNGLWFVEFFLDAPGGGGCDAAACGAAPTCSPNTQTVYENADAVLAASGGNGRYSWSGGGNPPTGARASFTTKYSSKGTYYPTVTSHGGVARCQVVVLVSPS